MSAVINLCLVPFSVPAMTSAAGNGAWAELGWTGTRPISTDQWGCEGCGRVWDRKWMAETCEKRSHRHTFVQSYPTGRDTQNFTRYSHALGADWDVFWDAEHGFERGWLVE